MRVCLVRHAAATTPVGITVGAGDPPLSEAGQFQARLIAVSLAQQPLVKVWSSDLRRAVETASIIAADHKLSVETTPLRELDFGEWEGRDLRELWRGDPDAARAWEADITDAPASFGESVCNLELRGDTAVVAHRGSLAALRSTITGRRFEESFRAPAAWVEAEAKTHRRGRSASQSHRRRGV